MMKTNKAHDLVYKALDGELSPEEERRLGQMPDALDALREFEDIRSMTARYGAGRFQPGFADRVMEALPSGAPSARIIRLSGAAWLRAAAVFLLLVSISWIVWLQPRTVTVPNGRQIQRLLPDGTSVLLSSGSTLRYKPFWGRSHRRVELEGEAFFEVTKAEKPFLVETFNAEVRVLGTRFNVKAWPASIDSYTAVALEEGRVEVTADGAPEVVYEMAPTESTVIYADSVRPLPPNPTTLENMLAWRQGGLGFDDEPLGNVTAELERRYNVRLALAPELRHRRITYLKPNVVPLDTVLSDLSNTIFLTNSIDLKYRQTANGYELYRP